MPQNPNRNPDDSKHDATIAKVLKNAQDIDKKMAGQKALKALLEQGRLLLSLVKDYVTGAYREVPYYTKMFDSLGVQSSRVK